MRSPALAYCQNGPVSNHDLGFENVDGAVTEPLGERAVATGSPAAPNADGITRSTHEYLAVIPRVWVSGIARI